jgi:hypothetical protein
LVEEGSSRESVAADCRAAALEFMAGVASGWEKVDVAHWLTGPYARATRHCHAGERTLVGRAPSEVASLVSPETLEELLVTTRSRMLAFLETAVLANGSLAFAGEVVERGFVRRAAADHDDGDGVWIPVDGARMRLMDRVRALFVADYLNAPEFYQALYVCHRCERVVFDKRARELGMCNAHRRASGIVGPAVEEPFVVEARRA